MFYKCIFLYMYLFSFVFMFDISFDICAIASYASKNILHLEIILTFVYYPRNSRQGDDNEKYIHFCRFTNYKWHDIKPHKVITWRLYIKQTCELILTSRWESKETKTCSVFLSWIRLILLIRLQEQYIIFQY